MQIVFIDRLEIGIKHIVELQYLSPASQHAEFLLSRLRVPQNSPESIVHV